MSRNNNFHSSLANAIRGLKFLFRTQRNARIHFSVTILVILAGIFLKLSLVNWIWILLAIGIVWIAELFNTSLECFFDLVEPAENDIVKAGKDTSAAAVLLTSILSVLIGLLVLGPLLIQRIKDLFS